MDANTITTAASSSSFPWLSLIVLLPAVSALIIQFLPQKQDESPDLFRNIAIGVLAFDFLIILFVLSQLFTSQSSDLQLIERTTWLPSIGLEWSLGVDGISAPLVALSGLITLLSATASWKITNKPKLYFSLLLIQASAQALVFLSQDFLLFFLAWELELVPVYLLIAIWGGRKRLYAATKFILYTALASLLILVSGLALALSGDSFTLNLSELTARSTSGTFGLLCYLGFLIGFGVKLPIFPLHTWLPDAHGEANAPVSMLLAGILLKMGGYALIRFNVQMFPEIHIQLSPALIVIGIVNIIYGALNAFAQDNVKRRIACSSVSHMGFVLLGIGAINTLGINGAMLQMISHGLIAAAMFFITGSFYERTNTLSIPNMGGLAKALPITFALFLTSSLASLALPGMSGFVSEITIFLGITSQDAFTSIFRSISILIAAIGLVLTPVYLLSMCRRVFFGPRIPALAMVEEMNSRELLIALSLLVPTLFIGFWPRIATDLFETSTDAIASNLLASNLITIAPIVYLN
ncbi:MULTISPECIES: NAD(P)H-quinone oxidoreductase subunit 4 [Prochlorococcus]|uniref:NAD(P)H-quinone oxidoreductase NdhD subunit n=1 Tax=Prochlorococcus marinus (strain SARG / CCMP1375 / SS120) TaxID=167539 RepID=Q7VBM5_PROMA|nr:MULTISPECIES: NAD(P)H-quinone oxidoreductase subunit 4 [Prochlorococcus]AAQ00112.1 NAD(P)H-quinone oxidoreductase NdhD subunit [Prochlorococcus marinus subsp. marinus str. CCMP1375]KGG13908.1 NADH dehydrogenase I subunit 4 [Prochlorococcus marinus str. LG]KGG19041.1 NADH dehydrogenase I subunit 4 [Prochlorococcus marinus str. SS2]KGG23419.1 NADH dehydrogenase I subunit 4 [Prochlorococcus marinus str. SS35]KGG32345.1 NADH dehydrogenase I subunit 4 [Prochlorococcus marinus str. SS51]